MTVLKNSSVYGGASSKEELFLETFYVECDVSETKIALNIPFYEPNRTNHRSYKESHCFEDVKNSLKFCFNVKSGSGFNNIQLAIGEWDLEIILKEIVTKMPSWQLKVWFSEYGQILQNRLHEIDQKEYASQKAEKEKQKLREKLKIIFDAWKECTDLNEKEQLFSEGKDIAGDSWFLYV
jgi:hypothetical protein